MSASTERLSFSRMRRGFALPLAILALALVTAAVAASNVSTRAEVVANQATRAQEHAYELAEAGLQYFMANRGYPGFTCDHCVTDPGVSQWKADTTEMSRIGAAHGLVGGYADVMTVRVRPKSSDSAAVFFIWARGVDTTVKMSGTGLTTYAQRTLGLYASFKSAFMKPVAAYMSITGLTNSSGTASIQGVDECGAAPTLPGLAVPTGEFSGTSTNITGSGATPSISYSSVAALKAMLGVDWNAVVNQNAIPADYTDTWPGATWAVTRITSASYTIPSDGNGILIALGDISFSGNRDFDGIMLVGGKITTSGSQPSSGAILTGLNYLLPGAGTPPAGTADNSTIAAGSSKAFRYNSCMISQAMGLLNNYFAWSNTWLDNVAVW